MTRIQYWDTKAVRPWATDDKFSLDTADYSMVTLPADRDAHLDFNIPVQGKSPVFTWDVDLSRVGLSSGEWLTLEIQFIIARDDGFRLDFKPGAWSFEVDATQVLKAVRKVVGHSTINSAIAYGVTAVAGKVVPNLVGKRLVLTLRSQWLPGPGSGSGLEVALLVTMRSFRGWLVPTPNEWYPVSAINIPKVQDTHDESVAEAGSSCDSDDWQVLP